MKGMRKESLGVFLLVAAAVAGVLGFARIEARESGLIFSHKAHSDASGCLDCHPGAVSGARAGMPDKETCRSCHEEADHSQPESGACSLCHQKPIQKPLIMLPEVFSTVVFNHARHAKSAPEDCLGCHGGVPEAETLSEVGIPTMQKGCARCHEPETGRADGCSKCHTEKIRERTPEDHDSAWKRRHGADVKVGFPDKKWYRCNFCHDENACNSCHRQEPPVTHTESWRRRLHGLNAEADRLQCRTCHQEYECLQCHTSLPLPDSAIHRSSANCTSSACHGRTSHGFWSDNCIECHR